MNISTTLDRLHSKAKQNKWLWLFSIFCRVILAFGFFVAGMVKVIGERFASGLSVIHPMGSYLEALHHTGFYYTFIGIAQIAAAIFLLIPRCVTLGAFIYFPIILNICILTFATRFEGSLFTAPLMTLANLYLLGWNYEKWKYILPFNRAENNAEITEPKNLESKTASRRNISSHFAIRPLYARFRTFLRQLFNDKFPTLFFAGVFAVAVFFAVVSPRLFNALPRNSFAVCQTQFTDTDKTEAGIDFCTCVHKNGTPLDQCLDEYEKSIKTDAN